MQQKYQEVLFNLLENSCLEVIWRNILTMLNYLNKNIIYMLYAQISMK